MIIKIRCVIWVTSEGANIVIVRTETLNRNIGIKVFQLTSFELSCCDHEVESWSFNRDFGVIFIALIMNLIEDLTSKSNVIPMVVTQRNLLDLRSIEFLYPVWHVNLIVLVSLRISANGFFFIDYPVGFVNDELILIMFFVSINLEHLRTFPDPVFFILL